VTQEDARLGRDSRLRRYESLAEMIGDAENPTPLVGLRHMAPDGIALYVKLEWMNPFGSVKDRAAKWMIDKMEQRGDIQGRTVIEPTSGNTGIALAAICALAEQPMTAVVPQGMPAEKSALMRVLGADVISTPAAEKPVRHPMDQAIDMAVELVTQSERYVMPNQYDNPDNARAHYETTGPEIWAQTEGAVRYFFAGIGTGGTISGVGRYLKEREPAIRIIGIEPVSGHRISGLKNLQETAVPAILDRSVIDEIIYVDDAETLECARRLHAEEALLAGSSAAACLAGALRWLSDNDSHGVVVAIAPDSSQKAASYLRAILGEE